MKTPKTVLFANFDDFNDNHPVGYVYILRYSAF